MLIDRFFFDKNNHLSKDPLFFGQLAEFPKGRDFGSSELTL